MASTSAHAYSGKIIQMDGDVTASMAEPFTKASIGQVILANETVKTGANSSATLEFEDGSIIKLNPRSVLTVGKSKTNSEVNLMMGSSLAQIAKQKTGQFKLKTRTATMGVRGTNFFTSYGDTKSDELDVRMAVNEGVVAVEMPGEAPVAVTKGLGIVASPGKKMEAPKAYNWVKKLNWDMSAATEKKKVVVARVRPKDTESNAISKKVDSDQSKINAEDSDDADYKHSGRHKENKENK